MTDERAVQEVYAVTRLDALRQLRREGYVVVSREPYERWRKATVDDPTCIYHETERYRRALERIAQEPAPGSTVSARNIAKTALDPTYRGDPHGVPAESVPAELPDTARTRQPWEFFDGD